MRISKLCLTSFNIPTTEKLFLKTGLTPHTSLQGEKSRSRLHKTDDATLMISSDVLVFSAVMTGCQILTSWKVVLNCCTERDKLRRHCSAAAWSGRLSFWSMALWMVTNSLEQPSTIYKNHVLTMMYIVALVA